MQKQLLLLLACCTFWASCTKSDDDKGLSASAKLTGKSWYLTGYIMNYEGIITDGYSSVKRCQSDNYFIFRPDYKVEQHEGDTKCDPADEDVVINSTWEFLSGDTELKINIIPGTTTVPYGITAVTATVLELSSTKMVLQYSTPGTAPGLEVINTSIYTAK